MDPSTWVRARHNTSRETHLHALVVQLQTVLNTTREHVADLGAIPTLLAAAFHPALLVHDAALDDAVANRLADNVLRVLLRVEVEFDADVAQRDARVREREPAHAGLDDVLPQTHDEGVRLVGLKLCRMPRQRGLELGERTVADR